MLSNMIRLAAEAMSKNEVMAEATGERGVMMAYTLLRWLRMTAKFGQAAYDRASMAKVRVVFPMTLPALRYPREHRRRGQCTIRKKH